MPDPTDPNAAPDSARLSAMRRPLLTITGLSLLSLGAFMNADRLGLERSDAQLVAAKVLIEEPPPEEIELEASSELDNGQRHKGEEGKMGKATSKSREYSASPHGGTFVIESNDGDLWGK